MLRADFTDEEMEEALVVTSRARFLALVGLWTLMLLASSALLRIPRVFAH